MAFKPMTFAAAMLLSLLPAVTGYADMQDGANPPASNDAAPANSAPGGDAATTQSGDVGPETYSKDETLAAAQKFFGGTTEGLAKAIEKAFGDLGQPNAYIVGNEGAGAFIVGLRYGSGTLYFKNGGSMPVYWQGPSVGFDFGGNASKTFTLVYNLRWTRDLFQRYPGVDGSLYVVAGVGLNYLRSGDITVAPIRTGVGLRAGANIGYLTFTREKSYNPF